MRWYIVHCGIVHDEMGREWRIKEGLASSGGDTPQAPGLDLGREGTVLAPVLGVLLTRAHRHRHRPLPPLPPLPPPPPLHSSTGPDLTWAACAEHSLAEAVSGAAENAGAAWGGAAAGWPPGAAGGRWRGGCGRMKQLLRWPPHPRGPPDAHALGPPLHPPWPTAGPGTVVL